ncbi:hypothetical protein PF003_g8329 [Phytophthora fragariae]|nr:hypothetical protein PF003_g8329 [Phytophthora fragariae]
MWGTIYSVASLAALYFFMVAVKCQDQQQVVQ